MIKPLAIALLLGAMLSIIPVAQAQFLQPPDWARPAAGTVLPELKQKLWLIKAEVIDVKNDEEGLRSLLKVTHVYCGADQLLGKTFSAYTPKSGVNWNGVYLIPAMHQGENGIFVLRYNPNRLPPGGTLAYTRNGAYGYDFPAREKDNPNFNKARAYAETIEKISKAKPDDQIKLLKNYASSQKSPIGAWAISSLAAIQPDKMAAFIENLSTQKLPIKSQLAVDDVLLDLREATWPKSQVRFQLLQKIVDSKLDDTESRTIGRKIDTMLQSDKYADAQFLSLLNGFINNPSVPSSWRRSTVSSVGWAAKEGKFNKDDAVALLLKWIKESTDEGIRVVAAATIANKITASDQQITKVQELKKQFANDPVISDLLQQAIDRAEDK